MQSMAYRSEVWLRILANIVGIFIQVAIWTAILGNSAASGIHLKDMITYVVINTCISTVLLDGLFRAVDSKLRTGNIAGDLIRPISFPLSIASDQLGQALFRFLFTVIPTIIISVLFFGVEAPASSTDAFSFIVALIVAMAVSFAIGYLIALLAFWFLATLHFEWTLGGLITVFSGSILPLWFFSPRWADVAYALPFQYLGFVPAAVYMGKFSTEHLIFTLVEGLLWAMGLLSLTRLLWWRAMKRLIVQGG